MQLEIGNVLKIIAIGVTLSLAAIGYAICFGKNHQIMVNQIEDIIEENKKLQEQIDKLREREKILIKTTQQLKVRVEDMQLTINRIQTENNVIQHFTTEMKSHINESQVELFQLFIEANKSIIDQHTGQTR